MSKLTRHLIFLAFAVSTVALIGFISYYALLIVYELQEAIRKAGAL